MVVHFQGAAPKVNAEGQKVFDGKLACSPENLTSAHRAALDSYLLEDFPISKLIKIVKDEWGEFPGVPDTTVRQMLYRYKRRVVSPKQVHIAAKHSTEPALQALALRFKELEARMDPMLVLEDLVLRQAMRVEKMALVEKDAPTLLDTQTRNIALMSDLLKNLITTQLEVGVLKRVPKKMQVQAVDVTDEEREFMESAKLSDSRAGFLVDALRLLRTSGAIDVASRELPDDSDS